MWFYDVIIFWWMIFFTAMLWGNYEGWFFLWWGLWWVEWWVEWSMIFIFYVVIMSASQHEVSFGGGKWVFMIWWCFLMVYDFLWHELCWVMIFRELCFWWCNQGMRHELIFVGGNWVYVVGLWLRLKYGFWGTKAFLAVFSHEWCVNNGWWFFYGGGLSFL